MRHADQRALKTHLWAQGHRNCAYCGIQLRKKWGYPDSVSLDHKLPICRGGYDGLGNVVLACHGCNMAKGDMTVAEFTRQQAARVGPRVRAQVVQQHQMNPPLSLSPKVKNHEPGV